MFKKLIKLTIIIQYEHHILKKHELKCHGYEPIAYKTTSNNARISISDDKTFYNDSNVLVNLVPNAQHILLLYEDENDLLISVKTYLNEGLKRAELCIHVTVNLIDASYIENFSSQIEDYQENTKKFGRVE